MTGSNPFPGYKGASPAVVKTNIALFSWREGQAEMSQIGTIQSKYYILEKNGGSALQMHPVSAVLMKRGLGNISFSESLVDVD